MWSSLLSTRGHLSCLRVAILPVYTWPSFLSSHGHPSNLQEAILPVDRWPLAIHPVYSGHLKTVSSGHHTCQQMAIIPCLLLPTLPILTRTIWDTSISFRGPSDNLSQLDLSLPKICPKPEAGDGHKMWTTLPTWLLHVEPPLFPESKFLWHTSNRRQGNTLESWIPIILWFCMQYQVWNTEDILLDLFRTIS